MDIARDRWGRPLITPPEGGKPVPYLRASSIGKILDDETSLARWKQRMTALGVVANPDLAASIVAAGADDRRTLDELCEKALERGGGTARRDLGAALHKLTEHADLGVEVTIGDPTLAADVDAYRKTAEGFEVLDVECFVVADRWQIAGTFDRLIRHPELGVVVADIKTGSTLQYSWGSHAMQLAAYAHGQRYDPDTSVRSDLHPDVRRDVGVIIHLPAGEAHCSLHRVDLTPAVEAIETALWVRDWRKRSKRLGVAIEPVNDVASWADVEQAVSDERRAWIRSKVKNFAATVGLHEVNRVWPEGVPKRADQLTSDHQVDAISAALDSLLVPSQESNTGEPPYLDEPADMQDVAFMQQRLDELTDAQRARLNDIARQAHAAGYPISVRADPTVRKLAIANALIDAVEVGLIDDDEWLEAALSLTESPPVGQMTALDAEALSTLADSFERGNVTADFSTGTLTLNHK